MTTHPERKGPCPRYHRWCNVVTGTPRKADTSSAVHNRSHSGNASITSRPRLFLAMLNASYRYFCGLRRPPSNQNDHGQPGSLKGASRHFVIGQARPFDRPHLTETSRNYREGGGTVAAGWLD